MSTTIQLLHPAAKKAVRMDRTKYDRIRTAILDHLERAGSADHSDLLRAVTAHFGQARPKFEGSVAWHLEWVKLDLEARKIIVREVNKKATEYRLAK